MRAGAGLLWASGRGMSLLLGFVEGGGPVWLCASWLAEGMRICGHVQQVQAWSDPPVGDCEPIHPGVGVGGDGDYGLPGGQCFLLGVGLVVFWGEIVCTVSLFFEVFCLRYVPVLDFCMPLLVSMLELHQRVMSGCVCRPSCRSSGWRWTRGSWPGWRPGCLCRGKRMSCLLITL